MSLTDINARLTSIQTGITHIKVNVDNLHTYWKYKPLILFPLFYPTSDLREIKKSINGDMAQHPWPALPSDPDEDIWNYYELL